MLEHFIIPWVLVFFVSWFFAKELGFAKSMFLCALVQVLCFFVLNAVGSEVDGQSMVIGQFACLGFCLLGLVADTPFREKLLKKSVADESKDFDQVSEA